MLSIKSVSKSYDSKSGSLQVLDNVTFSLSRGELCALTGASGSGKSTLLNLLSLIDRPDCGTITFNGLDVTAASSDVHAELRGHDIGIVFQSFMLLEHMSALENVALPLLYRGHGRAERLQRAFGVLGHVGLADRVHHMPSELSGGQKQRVAIARALIGSPRLVLADEPTGNLDSQSAEDVMSLFIKLNASLNISFLIVTHDPTIAARCHRRIVMRDGKIVDANLTQPAAIGQPA